MTATTTETGVASGATATPGSRTTADVVAEAVLTARPPAPAAYRDANVLRWLTGFGVSLLGDHVYFIALTWSAGRASGPSGAGMVLACGSLPRLVLLLVGGAVADRFDVRRLMLGSDVVRCGVMIIAAVATASSDPSLTTLIMVAMVFGVVDAIFLPAVGALPQHLVGPDQYGRIQGLRMVVARGAMVAGAPVGGAVVTMYGVCAAFAVNAVSFAASVLALAATRLTFSPGCAATKINYPPTNDPTATTDRTAKTSPSARTGPTAKNDPSTRSDLTARTDPAQAGGRPPRGGGLRGDVRAGLAVAARSPLVRTVLVAMALSEVGFSGPFNVGIALLVQERGWRAAEVGLILGGFGAGAAVAAAAAVALGRLPRAGLTFGLLIIMMAGGLAGIGCATSQLWAATSATFLGVGGGLASVIAVTLLQAHTPPGYIGRVMSLTTLASFGTTPVSCALTGELISAVGSPAAFLVASVVAASGAVAALSTRVLREAELPGGAPPTDPADPEQQPSPALPERGPRPHPSEQG